MIIREKYLSKIRPFYDQDLIKVIMGVRRCGKSVILLQIIDELKARGIPESQIIYINFEYEDYSFIKNDMDLHNYIKEKIVSKDKYYLFFDEIQNVEHWEKAINSFKASKNVSIFITGSNSDLLSGELATHIAGRYVSFKTYPFTFKEVCELKNITDRKDIEEVFDDYIEKPFESKDLLNKIDEWLLSIKVIERDNNLVNFSKELPMDKEQFDNLKKLREQNLGYLMLRGTRDLFITHRRIF